MSKLFVPDQRLFRLKLTHAEREAARKCLTVAHLPDYDQALEDQPGSPRDEYRSRWESIQNRVDYLTHLGAEGTAAGDRQQGRRLCITSLAGVGKSICLQQLAFVRGQRVTGEVVLTTGFAELPADAEDVKLWQFLIKQIHDRVEKKLLPHLPKLDDIKVWLTDLAEVGRLTLVVDALDEDLVVKKWQGQVSQVGRLKAKALRAFLQRFPRVHCVVAGRPYAITQDYWADLFARQPSNRCDASDWEFCLSEVFTPAQAALSLGEARLASLSRLTFDGRLNPRTLDVIRTLLPEEISKLRSLADVYWYGFSESLGKDRRTETGRSRSTNLTFDQIIELLGALAITCVQGGAMEMQIALESLSHDVEDRINRAVNSGRPHNGKRINAIKKLKQLYEFGAQFVEISSIIDLSPKVRWVNATQRDFFAALWLLRRENPTELQWLSNNPPRVVLTWTGSKFEADSAHCQNAAQYQLWCFICGMPDAAFQSQDPDASRWVQLVRPLFTRPVNRPRPTELMVLSWPNLLRRAGYLTTAAWDESKLQSATRDAQRAADPILKQKVQPHGTDAFAAARQLVLDFLSEYPRLRAGEAKAICHEDLESQWKSCESVAGQTFWAGDGQSYGSNSPREKTLHRGFELCAIPVTRRLYAIFDPCHEEDFGDYARHSPESRCPAIYLSYWDSVMVSIWLHGCLLDEWEWEYACRGGKSREGAQQDIWWWGDDRRQLVKHAWVFENSEGRTHAVGQRAANPYELHDMLGNVWEWTSSLWSEKGTSRVVRGGSFRNESDDARCSNRDDCDPSKSLRRIGCRVARADF